MTAETHTTKDTDQTSSGDNKRLQNIALIFCALVLASLVWFWSEQIADVIEMLELAYGEGS